MTVLQQINQPEPTAQSAAVRRAGGHGDYLLPESERLSLLLQGQQEALDLLLRGVGLEDVLRCLALAIERALAPVACGITLVDPAGGRIHLRAAPSLSSDLVRGMRDGLPASAAGPTESAVLGAQSIAVDDFAADVRWPEHAATALANGFRACRAEPIRDGDDRVGGVVTLYYPAPPTCDAGDERMLKSLAPLVGFVVGAAEREQALHAGSERFAALAALPGVVVYQRLVTPDDQIRYTYISEGARDLFGVPAAEILSDPKALFSCHGPDYSAKFRERLLEASAALTTWDVEASILSRDGHKKYTHAIARPQGRADGSVLWTGVILDETRTREAIVESLSIGFVLYDPEDRLVIRNSHFIDLYPSLRELAVPGAKYQDVVCGEVACSPDAPTGPVERTPAYRWRIKRHSEPHNVFERPLDGDRWVLIHERRTSEGGTVVLYTDISELKRRESQVRHMAYHDALTGLPNRTLFQQRIETALARARKRGSAVAVMCLDVDHLKSVNDSLGHAAGDALLKCVADRLQASLRDIDTVARLDGDEFGVLLANLPGPAYAETLAWRLLGEIREPMDFDGQQIVIDMSIGIAISTGGADEADPLIKNSDLALGRAKADGRATVRFFEPEMDARAQARRALEIDLRDAIAQRQLVLHYQPQIDIRSNEVLGFEALVRWCHPQKGVIAPLDFIPLAEETGLILRLGEWVLRQACSDAMTWPETMRVAVNVSPAQFKDHDLAKTVADILRDTGLPPDRLELEITESLLLRDVEANLQTLHDLKGQGIRISMDDFGTGYSSLGNLRSFAFDKIKIDRSFVGDLERKPDAAAIIRAVLGLGHSLGMEICAEGVETDAQLAFLRDEGCVEVQGFYYSRPKPIGEITAMLRARLPSSA